MTQTIRDIKKNITGAELIDKEHKCFRDQILNHRACCDVGDTITAPTMTDKVIRIEMVKTWYGCGANVVTESGQNVPMGTLCEMVDAGHITIN